ncbi:MAG TPA: M48 family metalloprotease [Candidatus Solibacter sp.]|nr:M48 family metalloprotease [Candidatus Solibacter sp.]
MLVYDRISWNRRNAFLLPLAALIMIAPLMLGLAFGLTLCLAKVWPTDTAGVGALLAASTALMFAPCLVLWGLLSSEAPKLLGVFGARLAPDSEQCILENLALGAGLPKPRLFVIESGAPNAFAIGVSGSAVVGVTRALLNLLDRRELEGVLAHELSHIGNRDTQLNEVVTSLVLFTQLPRLLWRRHISIQEQTRLGAKYPLPPNIFGPVVFALLLPVWCYFYLVSPLMGMLLRGVISRDREFLADADAVLLTRYPEGLIRALAKVQGAGSLVNGNPPVAHFYFADVVGPEDALFGTHPSVSQRIARLVEIHGEIGPQIVESAMDVGSKFAREHPSRTDEEGIQVQDELSMLNMGNVMGKVYRALSPGCLYDRPDTASPVLAQIPQGALVVVFDDPGRFRQALTARGVFGYLPLSVRLEATDVLPAEIKK